MKSFEQGLGRADPTRLRSYNGPMPITRRAFLGGPAGLHGPGPLTGPMQFGLVTYLWGRDWDLPTLIRNCQRAGAPGVELRVDHAHGVETHLNAVQREEAKARFADSGVTLVGLGTNWAFHHPDPARRAHAISKAKASILLAHDVGASGVKVKPDGLPVGIPHEETIAHIGRSLRVLGIFGADHGQEVRLEVHGQGTESLPVIRAIMDSAAHPNVRVCWNCNRQDLADGGLEHNFHLVRSFFGQTVHVREFDIGDYPYGELFELLVSTEYAGWIMLEARTDPTDRVDALRRQRGLFDTLVARARP